MKGWSAFAADGWVEWKERCLAVQRGLGEAVREARWGGAERRRKEKREKVAPESRGDEERVGAACVEVHEGGDRRECSTALGFWWKPLSWKTVDGWCLNSWETIMLQEIKASFLYFLW